MENLNMVITPGMLALVPVVAAIIQTIKRIISAAPIPEKITVFIKEFLPVISMLVAFLILLSVYKQPSAALLPGAMVGLTACGGFDLMKKSKNV